MGSRVTGLGADVAPQQRTDWPLQSGAVPALAYNYCLRPETGIGADGSPLPGELLVLSGAGSAPTAPGVASMLGGSGKTQLAVATATEMLRARGVDLLIWANAASRDAVMTSYAQALADLSVARMADDIESAAPMLLEWLASTTRPWLVVLDDVSDIRDMDGLWPEGRRGRVIATARTADTVPPGPAVRTTEIGPLSHREAVNFLTAALKDDPDLRLGAPDLAEDLEGLPFALNFAAALITDRRLDCRAYRALLAERRQLLSGVAGHRWPLTALAAWSLVVDRAAEIMPPGLAWRTLALAAVLDPEGIPAAVLMSEPACRYLTGVPAVAEAQAHIRGALTAMARLGLVSVEVTASTRSVRMHPQVQHAVLSYISADFRAEAGLAAADAVLHAWSVADGGPDFEEALRECAARLREATGGLLWTSPGRHPLLVRAGDSLDRSGLSRSAVGYWQALVSADAELLGDDSPDAQLARGRLADAYERAGEPGSAVGLYERALTDAEDMLGPGHPGTLAALGRLATAYLTAGRTEDAITLHKRNLAARELSQGARHPDTITARARLADCYRSAGLVTEAVGMYERTLADRERVQGGRHADTIAARADLAYAYRMAGRYRDAIPVYLRTLTDREQVQGPFHPDTLAARGNLASAYHSAGRVKQSIPVYERTLADVEQVHGQRHLLTLTARGNLASAYHSAGRLADAIPIYERTIADSQEVLGHDHPTTLTLRSNLGLAYHTAGRLTEAIRLFRQTLADCERTLGPDSALTQTARENLEAVTRG
jgi:tetratricopeptide (TPR) repeat protein